MLPSYHPRISSRLSSQSTYRSFYLPFFPSSTVPASPSSRQTLSGITLQDPLPNSESRTRADNTIMHYLVVPYRYAIPSDAVPAMLHWCMSQSLFLVFSCKSGGEASVEPNPVVGKRLLQQVRHPSLPFRNGNRQVVVVFSPCDCLHGYARCDHDCALQLLLVAVGMGPKFYLSIAVSRPAIAAG